MSVVYSPVQWSRSKWLYDAVLVAMVVAYVGIFLHLAETPNATRPADTQIARMRAFGSCAFFLLSAILCIGPLARLDRRFLPLLYNRRHFGVIACLVAIAHAGFVMDWYFAFSPLTPTTALLASNTSFGLAAGFPFELFGILALGALSVLAATSHDFWLSFLTPPVWKAIHVAIYPAYAAVVAHVALGSLQGQTNPLFAVVVGVSAGAVAGLHWAAARAEPDDRAAAAEGEWERVGRPDEIAEGTAKVVRLGSGERVAVFRHEGRLAALSNACAHQNGPLGEGRILDGCVTCPWHGFQYRLEDGRSPAPFTETVPTYRLALRDGVIWVDARANPPGTPVEPLRLEDAHENA